MSDNNTLFRTFPASPMEKLISGLSKARLQFGQGLDEVDRLEGFLALLEERLLMADCGPRATGQAIESVRARIGDDGELQGPAVKAHLRDYIRETMAPLERPLPFPSDRSPFVLMVAGINGGGKTTTIAKLAHKFAGDGARVLISTSDTFRAAARQQVSEWASRLHRNVEFVDIAGDNPSAVAFDAVKGAVARKSDVLILDTAGRLPSQTNLMRELAKIRSVVGKAHPGAPDEVLLVLDATNGRNVLSQLKSFDDAVGVTGIAMTKLDGTAKGGTLLAIAAENPKPVRFVGVGEGMDDLLPFGAGVYASALVSAR